MFISKPTFFKSIIILDFKVPNFLLSLDRKIKFKVLSLRAEIKFFKFRIILI
jgi:hypothetical protein